jgi:hypothetical protein
MVSAFPGEFGMKKMAAMAAILPMPKKAIHLISQLERERCAR